MDDKSLIDVAYDVLTERYSEVHADGAEVEPMPFLELLLETGRRKGIDGESELIKIASKFYTQLTIDGRFVIKENNTWVLREHEKYESVHIDMNAAYSMDDYGSDSTSNGDRELELGEEEEEDEYFNSVYEDEDENN